MLAFALACSPCSLGRISWCGRSWIIVDGVCARPYPPPAIAMCLRWGGVGPVVSHESRVPALCGGYACAVLCGPLVASRPPGEPRNATNPHCIALGPPPVSPSLHRSGRSNPQSLLSFIARARPFSNASAGFRCIGSNVNAHKTRAAAPKREIAGQNFRLRRERPREITFLPRCISALFNSQDADGLVHTSHTPPSGFPRKCYFFCVFFEK